MKSLGNDTRPEEQQDSGADGQAAFATSKGRVFYVYQTPDDVWIDVSNLEPGDGGSATILVISFTLSTFRQRPLLTMSRNTDVPILTSRPEPSELVKASPLLMECYSLGVIPIQELERRAQGAERLREAFSSIPFHARKAADRKSVV